MITATSNLPGPLTSFVGRKRELATVERLLTETRLLTLTGTGGVGKTRLALEVAAGVAGAFADGVCLTELAALTDPALVPRVVAAQLGLREDPNRPALDTLTEHLRSRSQLQLLDNCEHLIGAVAELATALLRACPRLRIMATSRQPLAITGETAWRVPSLTVPSRVAETDGIGGAAATGTDTVSHLMEHESVRLFIERATAASPEFTLTERNAAAVADICHRLDGMPLALELAAARLRALTVEQVAARLDDRFRLLTAGSRTALPRQQTLRGTVDWSHDLLTEEE